MSQRRVGSDLRALYALGTVDDYELLKKEIGENCVAVHGMEARVKERLRGYDRMSPSKVWVFHVAHNKRLHTVINTFN